MAETMTPLVTTCAVGRKPDRARSTASRLIHRSAWKGDSQNFTLMELGIFVRVPPEYPVRGFTEGGKKASDRAFFISCVGTLV
jgi:hypothetical protein